MSDYPLSSLVLLFFFFFNDTATTEIYTLSLHDALPISRRPRVRPGACCGWPNGSRDRKSTRLNSSHVRISYAVFCLKKKTTTQQQLDANPNSVQLDPDETLLTEV